MTGPGGSARTGAAALPAGVGSRGDPGARRAIRLAALAVLVLVVSGAAVGALLGTSQSAAPTRPPRLQAEPAPAVLRAVPASAAALMGLTPMADQPAPAFRLMDQDGRAISLAGLRGKAIVLGFFDASCADVCPIFAREVLVAERDLGRRAGTVAFVAINVDATGPATASVATATDAHGLASLPNWYFLTGAPSALREVRRAYGIQTQVDPQSGLTLHTEALFFISASGRLRFEAIPFADLHRNGTSSLPATTVNAYGAGLAAYAERVAG